MSGPIPCRNCGKPVPPGRLACPACGTLVASVTTMAGNPGSEAADVAGHAPDPEPEPEPLPEAWAASSARRAPEPEPAAEPEPEPATEPEPEVAAATEAAPEPDVDSPDAGTAAPEAAPAVEPAATGPDAGAAGAAPLEAWAPRAAPSPLPEPRPAAEPETVAAAAASEAVATGGIVPGAYLPPSTVHRPAESASETPYPSSSGGWPVPAASSRPYEPPRSGAEWVPPSPVGSVGTGSPPSASVAGSKPIVPGRTSILADLPFDAPDQLEGWLVALGGIVAIVGFFLPWTAALGTGFDGYFGSWGLGILSHLPVFLFLVLVTALAILPNRVGTWLRTGVFGMVGGGILFGIVWLYLGSDASQLGALLSAVGAILLMVGGIIAVAPGRAARHLEDG